MRPLVAALVMLAAALPVQAADPIADQASKAYEAFAAGLSQQQFLAGSFGQNVLVNAAGTWVRLNGPDPKSGATTYGTDVEKFCAGNGRVTLASPDPMTLTLTTNLPKSNFTQSYTLVAGATFAEHTDAVPYLTAIGLGSDNTAPNVQEQRALALSIANGLVQVYRPSADILVMTRDRGYPLVLARCPAAT
jgi:hypothetical protein